MNRVVSGVASSALVLVFALTAAGCPEARGLGETCVIDDDCLSGFCYGECLEPNVDLDGDSLTNAREKSAGTNPHNPDTDLDGEADDVEFGLDINNPIDSDGDGQIDALESSKLDDDNDCVADEFDDSALNSLRSDAHLTQVCGAPPQGVCLAGRAQIRLECTVIGTIEEVAGTCNLMDVTGYEPNDICGNGLDDNCDGQVDEGCELSCPPCVETGDLCDRTRCNPDTGLCELFNRQLAECIDGDSDGIPDAIDPCPLSPPDGDGDGDGDGDNDNDDDGCADVEDCGPDDPTIHPGAEEACDGVDSNCSVGTPLVFTNEVFVSFTNGSDAAAGTRNTPFATIQHAVDNADGGARKIIVQGGSGGAYTESVTIGPGGAYTLEGGYDCDFTERNLATYPTRVESDGGAAFDIGSPLIASMMTFMGADETNSVAILAKSDFSCDSCRVLTGTGTVAAIGIQQSPSTNLTLTNSIVAAEAAGAVTLVGIDANLGSSLRIIHSLLLFGSDATTNAAMIRAAATPVDLVNNLFVIPPGVPGLETSGAGDTLLHHNDFPSPDATAWLQNGVPFAVFATNSCATASCDHMGNSGLDCANGATANDGIGAPPVVSGSACVDRGADPETVLGAAIAEFSFDRLGQPRLVANGGNGAPDIGPHETEATSCGNGGDCIDLSDCTTDQCVAGFCQFQPTGVPTDLDGDNACASDLDLDGDGYLGTEDDCNDGDITVFPGAPESCDGIDSDCSSAGLAMPTGPAIYVAPNFDGTSDGSIGAPYTDLAFAISEAVAQQTVMPVRVAAGTYMPGTIVVGAGETLEIEGGYKADCDFSPGGPAVLEAPLTVFQVISGGTLAASRLNVNATTNAQNEIIAMDIQGAATLNQLKVTAPHALFVPKTAIKVSGASASAGIQSTTARVSEGPALDVRAEATAIVDRGHFSSIAFIVGTPEPAISVNNATLEVNGATIDTGNGRAVNVTNGTFEAVNSTLLAACTVCPVVSTLNVEGDSKLELVHNRLNAVTADGAARNVWIEPNAGGQGVRLTNNILEIHAGSIQEISAAIFESGTPVGAREFAGNAFAMTGDGAAEAAIYTSELVSTSDVAGLETACGNAALPNCTAAGNLAANCAVDSLGHLDRTSDCFDGGVDLGSWANLTTLSSDLDFDGDPRPAGLTPPDIGPDEGRICSVNADCDDAKACTGDACSDGYCIYTPPADHDGDQLCDLVDDDDDGDGLPDDVDPCPLSPPLDSDDDGDGCGDSEDCKPGDPTVHPGAVELCDGVDSDCSDGGVDLVAGAILVDANQVDDSGDGSFTSPFKTIDAALAAANANGATRILLGTGQYSEPITLTAAAHGSISTLLIEGGRDHGCDWEPVATKSTLAVTANIGIDARIPLDLTIRKLDVDLTAPASPGGTLIGVAIDSGPSQAYTTTLDSLSVLTGVTTGANNQAVATSTSLVMTDVLLAPGGAVNQVVGLKADAFTPSPNVTLERVTVDATPLSNGANVFGLRIGGFDSAVRDSVVRTDGSGPTVGIAMSPPSDSIVEVVNTVIDTSTIAVGPPALGLQVSSGSVTIVGGYIACSVPSGGSGAGIRFEQDGPPATSTLINTIIHSPEVPIIAFSPDATSLVDVHHLAALGVSVVESGGDLLSMTEIQGGGWQGYGVWSNTLIGDCALSAPDYAMAEDNPCVGVGGRPNDFLIVEGAGADRSGDPRPGTDGLYDIGPDEQSSTPCSTASDCIDAPGLCTTDSCVAGYCLNLYEGADHDGDDTCDGDDTDDDGDNRPDVNDLCPRGETGVLDGDFDGCTVADGDCNDANAAVYPGAVEICDGWDNDCSHGGIRLYDDATDIFVNVDLESPTTDPLPGTRDNPTTLEHALSLAVANGGVPKVIMSEGSTGSLTIGTEVDGLDDLVIMGGRTMDCEWHPGASWTTDFAGPSTGTDPVITVENNVANVQFSRVSVLQPSMDGDDLVAIRQTGDALFMMFDSRVEVMAPNAKSSVAFEQTSGLGTAYFAYVVFDGGDAANTSAGVRLDSAGWTTFRGGEVRLGDAPDTVGVESSGAGNLTFIDTNIVGRDINSQAVGVLLSGEGKAELLDMVVDLSAVADSFAAEVIGVEALSSGGGNGVELEIAHSLIRVQALQGVGVKADGNNASQTNILNSILESGPLAALENGFDSQLLASGSFFDGEVFVNDEPVTMTNLSLGSCALCVGSPSAPNMNTSGGTCVVSPWPHYNLDPAATCRAIGGAVTPWLTELAPGHVEDDRDLDIRPANPDPGPDQRNGVLCPASACQDTNPCTYNYCGDDGVCVTAGGGDHDGDGRCDGVDDDIDDDGIPNALDGCPLGKAATSGDTDGDGDGCLAIADGDCDDGAPETYPGAPELPDGKDNNCDEGGVIFAETGPGRYFVGTSATVVGDLGTITNPFASPEDAWDQALLDDAVSPVIYVQGGAYSVAGTFPLLPEGPTQSLRMLGGRAGEDYRPTQDTSMVATGTALSGAFFKVQGGIVLEVQNMHFLNQQNLSNVAAVGVYGSSQLTAINSTFEAGNSNGSGSSNALQIFEGVADLKNCRLHAGAAATVYGIFVAVGTLKADRVFIDLKTPDTGVQVKTAVGIQFQTDGKQHVVKNSVIVIDNAVFDEAYGIRLNSGINSSVAVVNTTFDIRPIDSGSLASAHGIWFTAAGNNQLMSGHNAFLVPPLGNVERAGIHIDGSSIFTNSIYNSIFDVTDTGNDDSSGIELVGYSGDTVDVVNNHFNGLPLREGSTAIDLAALNNCVISGGVDTCGIVADNLDAGSCAIDVATDYTPIPVFACIDAGLSNGDYLPTELQLDVTTDRDGRERCGIWDVGPVEAPCNF